MSIYQYDWKRKSVQKQNQTIRGTNQSSGRPVPAGIRGVSRGTQFGGLSGGSIGQNAINTDQMGNIQSSSAFNLQHSILPLVTDLTLLVETFNAPNYTADIKIYGIAGSATAITVNRPDGSQMLCPPVGYGYDLGSNFGSSSSVFLQVYYNVFNDALGNGAFVANWGNVPFMPTDLASAFSDMVIPILASPSDINTGLIAGIAGTVTKTYTGPNF